MFVLEDLDHARGRSARMYAEVLGAGVDGLQPKVGDSTSASLEPALRRALRAARLDVSETNYIKDRGETAALRRVFGEQIYNIPVSSIKPITGNPFAASGYLQIVAGCLSLAEQFVPPTLNLDIPEV